MAAKLWHVDISPPFCWLCMKTPHVAVATEPDLSSRLHWPCHCRYILHERWGRSYIPSVFFFFLSGVCVRACPISFVGHLQGVSTRCRGSAYARTDAGYKEERQLGIDRASLSLSYLLAHLSPVQQQRTQNADWRFAEAGSSLNKTDGLCDVPSS